MEEILNAAVAFLLPPSGCLAAVLPLGQVVSFTGSGGLMEYSPPISEDFPFLMRSSKQSYVNHVEDCSLVRLGQGSFMHAGTVSQRVRNSVITWSFLTHIPPICSQKCTA